MPKSVSKLNKNSFLITYLAKENEILETYDYYNSRKELIGVTIRCHDKSTGKKQILPATYCYNEFKDIKQWRLNGFSDNGYKPIYGIEKLGFGDSGDYGSVVDNKPILIVEGEKTANKASKLLPEYKVISWLGGTSSADKANWHLLQGMEVIIWPDLDEPGIKAAKKIAQQINLVNNHSNHSNHSNANTYGKMVTIIDPSKLEFGGKIHLNLLPDKWDLADELPNEITIENVKESINAARKKSSIENSISLNATNKTYTSEVQLKSAMQDAITNLNIIKPYLKSIDIKKLQETTYQYAVSRMVDQEEKSEIRDIHNLNDHHVKDIQVKALLARSLFEIKYEKEVKSILKDTWYRKTDKEPMSVSHRIKCQIDATRITKMSGNLIEKMIIDDPKQYSQINQQFKELANKAIMSSMQKYKTRDEEVKKILEVHKVKELSSYSKKAQHSIAEQIVDHIFQGGSKLITDEQFELMKKSAIEEQQLIPIIKQQFKAGLQDTSNQLPENDRQLNKDIAASISFAVSKIRNNIYNNCKHQDAHEPNQNQNNLSHTEYNKIIRQTINNFNKVWRELVLEHNNQQDIQQQQIKQSNGIGMR